jgi:hypothetical protein
MVAIDPLDQKLLPELPSRGLCNRLTRRLMMKETLLGEMLNLWSEVFLGLPL